MQELNVLMREYDGLLPVLNHAHDPIFQRLPLEIISYISQCYVPDVLFDNKTVTYLDDIEDVSRDIAAPLVLGSVCKQWRHLAWSTPQLWTYVIANLEARNIEQQVGFFRDWLGRSGKLPLSILIYGLNRQADTSDLIPEVCNIIGLIIKEYSRWEMLDLRIPSVYTTLFVGDLQCKGPSILQSLRLERHDELETFHTLWLNLKSAIPAPPSIFLMNVRCKYINVRWENVTFTCFEAEELYLDEVFKLLQNAPQLQDCHIRDIFQVRGNIPLPEHIIVHRQLNDLTLRWPNVGIVHRFLSQISLPSLNRLRIVNGDEEHAAEALASLFKRSSCSLEILVLRDTIYDTDELISTYID